MIVAMAATMATKTTRRRFVPFDKANNRERDITFLTDRDPVTAVQKVLNCKASKLFLHTHIAVELAGSRYSSQARPEMLIASDNPKLDFIYEMLRDKDLMVENQYYRHHVRQNEIPDSTRIHDGAQVWFTTLGENCVVYPNAMIGSPALSCARDRYGRLTRFPHIGRVCIGDDVMVGSLTNISRGALEDTTIGNNVTIDDMVHIAHNCSIGDSTQVTAGAIFGGTVKTGRSCWIGLNATINDHITIGNHALIGSGAMVTKDVADYDIVAGVPARSIREKCNIDPTTRYRMVGY